MNVICTNLPIRYTLSSTGFPYLYVYEENQYIYYICALGTREDYPNIQSFSDLGDIANSWCAEYLPTIYYLGGNPVVYSSSPTQLQTFLGQNNIWSNADYVEVEYDLHETQNILARK